MTAVLELPKGIRSRHYDSAATAKLQYEAEALTPLDAAATTVAISGASGGAAMEHASLPGGAWCPVLDTDILGVGSMTHKGSYAVCVRVYAKRTPPQLRFAWAVGDVAHPTINDPVQIPGNLNWFFIALGQIRIDAAPVGTHRWRGVVQALAFTQGDEVAIDSFYLLPLDEGEGAVAALQQDSTLGISLSEHQGAKDASDNSNGGTITWHSVGGATEYDTSVTTGTTYYLKATDFGFAVPTGATISGIKVTVRRTGAGPGIVTDSRVRLIKAGVIQATDRADTGTPWPASWGTTDYGDSTDLWGGTWTAADINNSGFGVALAATQSNAEAEVDTSSTSGIEITVYYTTAGGFSTAADAVVFANSTAELRTDGMWRADSTGTYYAKVGTVYGDLPRLPPSGLENRPVELIVRPDRVTQPSGADSGLDTFTVQVKYRPCYLFRN